MPGDGVLVDAQTGRHADPEVVQHHVGPVEQRLDHRSGLGRADVEREAALAALARRHRVGGGPHRLATGWLDLDHVGPEVGEHLRPEGSRDERREVHDPQPVERTRSTDAARSVTVAVGVASVGEGLHRDRCGDDDVVGVAVRCDRDREADLGQVRIGQRLARAEHRLARDAGGPEPLDPLVAGLGGEQRPPPDGPLVQRTR